MDVYVICVWYYTQIDHNVMEIVLDYVDSRIRTKLKTLLG